MAKPTKLKELWTVLTQPTLVSLSFMLSACGSVPVSEVKAGAVQLVAKEDREGFDINGDQKNDVWRYFELSNGKRTLTRKTFDFNFDDKVDFVRHYDTNGEIKRDELDMDFNGQFDLFSIYKKGQLIRQEVSLKGDKDPEVIKVYDEGQLKHIMYDRDSDQNFEYWEYYSKQKLIATGLDTDLDGVPDQRSEVKE